MSSSSEAAHAEALRLMTAAQRVGATAADRRTLQEHLITLCSYPSYMCKAHFGTLVHKNFAEFEDLQDSAIDAILDLCEDEDEKVRKIGIKGLGTTAKAAKRWVRGNTGVLLQLLECPPGELELVHQALFGLLTFAPQDVFAVMADDCKGSEEENGASRRNILDFLYKHAKEHRKTILESGDYQYAQAEEAFIKDFEGVMATTAIAETRIILNMLYSCSTISGRKATKDSSARFSRKLTDSLRSRSTSALTIPLVRIYIDFLSRNPPVEGREVIRFMSKHGAALVVLACEKNDEDGKRLARRIQDKWMPDAIDDWKKHGQESKVVDGFTSEIASGVKEITKSSRSTIEKSSESLEALLLATYTLYDELNTRRSTIYRDDSDIFYHLKKDAVETRTTARPNDKLALDNIASIAERLSDEKAALGRIIPSWSRPAGRSAEAPRGPRSSTPAKQPPAGPSRSTPLVPRKSTEVPSGPASVTRKSPTRPAAPKVESPRPPSPAKVSVSKDARRVTAATAPAGNDSTRPSAGRNPATQPNISIKSSVNSAGRELFPAQKPLESIPLESAAQASDQSQAVKSRSLADRLGPAKRAREDAPAGSLLSRLGPQGSAPDAKRPRSSLPSAPSPIVPSERSAFDSGNGLLARMSGSREASRNGTPNNVSPRPTTMSIKRHEEPPQATQATTSPALSIFGRAASGTTNTSLSIKNRAQESTPRSISIKSASPAVDPDEGVVRKGRGFTKEQDADGDLIMPHAPSPSPVLHSGGFGWTPTRAELGGKAPRRSHGGKG